MNRIHVKTRNQVNPFSIMFKVQKYLSTKIDYLYPETLAYIKIICTISPTIHKV